MRRVKFSRLGNHVGLSVSIRAFGDTWTLSAGIFSYEFCLLRIKLLSCDGYDQMTDVFEFSFLWFSITLYASPIFETEWKDEK